MTLRPYPFDRSFRGSYSRYRDTKLQVLGSSHRRLSMANWRLVFNAVCLPVLMYGCQLWVNSSKTKSLMKKVQGVFNEGVKVISGAFCTVL
jgi:hypothetical protein